VYGLLSLLQLIRAVHGLNLVATGGIATAAGVAAALSAGARAVQVGSAFLLCPEAGTSAAHREALLAGGETALTRAFTGRLARGIRNEFMDQHGPAAPIAYPEIHHVTAPLRKAAREAYALAREIPASEVVRDLAPA
jgi:nitronate monooxygenase